MTLFRQINAVFSIILLLVLGTVLGIGFIDSRHYVQNELFTKAQDTATSLSLMMSQAGGDIAAMSKMADAVFKSGRIKRILLQDRYGNIIFEKKSDVAAEVPSWFLKLADLSSDTAVAEVFDKWRVIGPLTVQVETSEALDYLYAFFKKILIIFIVGGALGALFIYILLSIILEPLKTVIRQAEGVLHNRFIIQDETPSTVELKHVSMAMNQMVRRMKKGHETLSSVMAKNRELEYIDPLTKVGNRRFFMIKYDEYSNAEDNRGWGVVLAVRLADVQEANKIIGFDMVDRIYVKISKIVLQNIVDIDDAACFRVSGTEFVLLLPSLDTEHAKTLAELIVSEIRELIDTQFKEVSGTLFADAAISAYEHREPISQVLSSVDLALNEALFKSGDAVVVAKRESSLPMNKVAWRTLLEESMKEHRMEPVWEDVHAINRHKLFASITFDIITTEGERIPYSTYLSMLRLLKLFPKYIEYTMGYLDSVPILQNNRIAVEYPLNCLATPRLFEKVKEYIRLLQKRGVELIIEIPESDLSKIDVTTLRQITDELHRENLSFAISRFDADSDTVELLKTARPEYVKMYVGQFTDMSDSFRDSLIPILKTFGVKLLLHGIDEEHDIHVLSRQGADYFIIRH
ncbi:GGDEF and EAL domain proteins [Hydrogenimonas sp.]|nr:GGDEF and EAL domain proteins [Hydrogenimonas sp.]